MEDSQRGTLHVILTKGSDLALEVSADARQHLKLTSAAVGEFAGRYEDSVGLKANIGASSDPRVVAAAVNAQIQTLTPALLSSGRTWTLYLFFTANMPLCYLHSAPSTSRMKAQSAMITFHHFQHI